MGVELSFPWLVALALSGLFNFNPRDKTIQLPHEVWITVFNFLPLQDQCRCALTCRILNGSFKSTLKCTYTRCTADFKPTVSEFFNNHFFGTPIPNRNVANEWFCKKIADNEVGGTVSYRGTLQQKILFFDSLEKNSRIIQLDISDCFIDDGCRKGKTILDYLSNRTEKRVSSVKYLSLQYNNMTYEGLIFFLKKFPQLETLNISSNPIPFYKENRPLNWQNEEEEVYHPKNNRQLKIIGDHIGNLKVLKMNRCRFKSDQVEWLVEFLKTNTNLEELHLRGNEIHDDNYGHKIDLIKAADRQGNPLKLLVLSENGTQGRLTYEVKRTNLKVIV